MQREWTQLRLDARCWCHETSLIMDTSNSFNIRSDTRSHSPMLMPWNAETAETRTRVMRRYYLALIDIMSKVSNKV